MKTTQRAAHGRSDTSRPVEAPSRRPGVTAHATTFQDDIVRSAPARTALAVMRILMGWYFLWAFLDKTFGLGWMTPAAKAWVNGGSPASGFMSKAQGPFAPMISGMAGPVSDTLFMIGLLGLGVALLSGAGLRIAAVTGPVLMVMMYLGNVPIGRPGSGTNPIIDQHWMFAAIMVVAALTYAGDTWGVGRWWGRKVGDSIWR